MSRTLHYTRKIFGLFGWKRAAYFLLQAVLHHAAFAKWFDFVETSLPASTPDVFRIRLAMKPATRFVSRRFGVSERISALKDYYTMLTGRFSPAGIGTLMNECPLAEITGKTGKKYIISVEQRVAKEGVLSLFFIDPEVYGAAPLAILMGLISQERGKPVFTVCVSNSLRLRCWRCGSDFAADACEQCHQVRTDREYDGADCDSDTRCNQTVLDSGSAFFTTYVSFFHGEKFCKHIYPSSFRFESLGCQLKFIPHTFSMRQIV